MMTHLNQLGSVTRNGLFVLGAAIIVLIGGLGGYVVLSLYTGGTVTKIESSPLHPSPKNQSYAYGQPPVSPRDPLKQPFSSMSIWNMPLGKDAKYIDADLERTIDGETWAQVPYADTEHIILRPAAPLTPIYYSDAGWKSDKNRCVPTNQTIVTQLPLPDDFLVQSDGGNGILSSLMPDKRTIRQVQPFARCGIGMKATALVSFSDVDIYGLGITGAHGGSNLSGIGGSLRVGELRKGGPAPRHTLKMNVFAKRVMVACKVEADCFRWPASTADGYAVGNYGVDNQTPISAVRMGALLAIPAKIDIERVGFETEPAQKLAWTLQNYGAYIVDDTYYPGVAFSTEESPDGSFVKQFEKDYGMLFKQAKASDSPWRRDIAKLLRSLSVVDNNSAKTPGGPGKRLQPLAPRLAEPLERATQTTP